MSHTYLDRTLIRGDTRRVNITVRDTAGLPVDLTGCKAYFTLSASDNPSIDSTPPLAKTTTSHTDPVNGKTSILLTHDDTDGITPGPYWFDAQVRDAFGQIVSKQKARMTVDGDITRSIF